MLRRVWPWIVLLVVLPWTVDTVAAQNTCVSSQWSETSDARSPIRPEVDEYRANIRFVRQAGCPVGCPNANATQARFDVVNPPQWLNATFGTNPAPINGSAQPLSARSTETDLRFRLNRSAPNGAQFQVRVEASCGGQVSQASRVFRVGSLVDVTADVIGAAAIENGVQWVLRVTNRGNADVSVQFEPYPPEEKGILDWTLPDFQVVPAPQDEPGSLAVAVTISARAREMPANLSVALRVSEADGNDPAPIEIHLPLPYVVFEGTSTPTAPLGAVIGTVVGIAFFSRRR